MENEIRELFTSGSPYESVLGFSRAVRVGNIVTISGTAPLDKTGKTVGRGNPAEQAKRCLEIIRETLEKAGASLADVTRTRIFLTRVEDISIIANIHGNLFRDIRPACTVMQVARFIDPDWLVEIEADAIVGK